MRELKYTLLRKKDYRLPLKERGYKRLKYSNKMNIKVGAEYLMSDKEMKKCIKGIMQKEEKPGTAQPQKVTWYLLPVDLQLAILHPTEGPNDPSPVIRHLMPLQNIELHADKLERKLQISYGHASYSILLNSEEECMEAKAWLEKERNKLRDYKLKQIFSLFANANDEEDETEPDDEDDGVDDEDEDNADNEGEKCGGLDELDYEAPVKAADQIREEVSPKEGDGQPKHDQNEETNTPPSSEGGTNDTVDE